MNAEQILELNKRFGAERPEEVLKWAAEYFNGQVVFSTALGAEDQVITDMIFRNKLNIPQVTLDTGRMFDETYKLLRENEQRYNMRIKVFFPDAVAVESMVNEHGINLFRDSIENRKLCCRVRKIEPLKRALTPYSAWICGLRREQSITRNEINVIDWDESNQKVKINPLASWTEQEVWDYIRDNAVPYNELHDKGFPSIGCAGCTRAVKRSEHVRAGRWWWEAPEQKECGLHLVDGKLVRKNK
ncbi:MAG: phosphoadenylyl-sulfate reductase [Victivallaceae bacterium]